MIEVELNEDEQSVGTFVNLQASIDAHEKTFHTEFEPLHRGTELTHHEFESITNADVNKLQKLASDCLLALAVLIVPQVRSA